MVEDIDETSWKIREVYAKFGLALYYAQLIEKGLTNLLILRKLSKKEFVSMDDLNSFMKKNYRKTMGSLLKAVQETIQIPDSLETDLNELLTRRNELAHNFFWNRAVLFAKEDGQNEMIIELDVLIEKFQKIDEVIDSISFMYANKLGITEELMNQKMEEMLRDGTTDELDVR